MKRRLILFLLVLPMLALAGAGQLRVGEAPPHELAGLVRVGDVDYLPAEPILVELGANVFWNAAVRRLTIDLNDRIATTSPLADFALVDGTIVPLQHPPRFIGGRLCLPLSFYEKALPLLLGEPVTLAGLQPVAPSPFDLRLYVDRSRQKRKMLSLHKIVLDAGHGGHDPGARSPQGIREKDINLAITLQLAAKLKKETDLNVILTRDDDTFIPLSERTEMANEAGAELFMSIHANGAYNRSATGFEVYFLSSQASDERTAALAAFENRQAGPMPADNPFGGGDDLNNILRDMIRTENLAASERLAVAIQARLDIAMHIENRGVKQAPFYVLAGAQMPAVLVEVGFLSNPREAALLQSQPTQDIIVSALYQAIMYYDAVNAATVP